VGRKDEEEEIGSMAKQMSREKRKKMRKKSHRGDGVGKKR
jgi:hypothetical protein